MVLCNVSLDNVAYIQLVMAVGLTVDYVIHVTHAIADAEPYIKTNYRERIQIAMDDMGIGVTKGALTTLLGVMTLIFSQSQAFRVFFFMFCGIVTIAILHGILFVPAIMGQLSCIYLNVDRVPDKIKKQLTIDVHVSVEVASNHDVNNPSDIDFNNILRDLWNDADVEYDIHETLPPVQESDDEYKLPDTVTQMENITSTGV